MEENFNIKICHSDPHPPILGGLRSVYFVGAGGIGMSAIARYFMSRGLVVAGYDKTPSELTHKLEQEGMLLHYDEDIEKIPQALKIVVLKEEKRLELWGIGRDGSADCIKTYRILSASGKRGPKLREGDLQVPEGDYAVESLHPNSLFYLALRVNYPSDEDIAAAKAEGRDPAGLGSDIMIHGAGGSVGCVAVTDNSIEEVFYLAAKVGLPNVRLLLCPCDFRDDPVPETTAPPWLKSRYLHLAEELARLKK